MPVYVYPILIVAGLIFLGVLMRAAVARANPDYAIGAITNALGLRLVEGDPNYHLTVGAKPNFLLSLLGVTKYETRIVAEGAIGTHGLALRIYEKVLRIKLKRLVVVDQHDYDASIVLSRVALPFPFEVWRASDYGPTPRCNYPVVGQLQCALGTWHIASPNPTAAAWLVPALQMMADQAHYFHVIGGDGTLTIPLTSIGTAQVCAQLVMLRGELLRAAQTLAGQAGPQQGRQLQATVALPVARPQALGGGVSRSR